jgi:hypothetical protein
MLGRCHAQAFVTNPPDIARWHKGFTSVLDVGEEGYRLMPIARHVAVDCGLTYPLFNEVDKPAYIDSLKTPHGLHTYDEVFDKALRHVVEGWHLIAEAVFGNSTVYQTGIWIPDGMPATPSFFGRRVRYETDAGSYVCSCRLHDAPAGREGFRGGDDDRSGSADQGFCGDRG